MTSLRNKLLILLSVAFVLLLGGGVLLGHQQQNSIVSVLAFLLPVSLLVIYVVVSLCLQPLYALAMKLRNREDLTRLSVEKMVLPDEIVPLVNASQYQKQIASESIARERRVARNAAHQIRNPVSILNVSLHNLENEFKQHGLESEALKDLQQGVVRISYILDQSLRFNAIQPATYSGQFSQVDLAALCRHCIANSYDQFLSQQQEIELGGESQLTVAGDEKLLETMLENLLSNASKYAPEKGRILVTLMRRELHIILRVEDSGSGIAESERHTVFEPFYRVGQDCHDSKVIGSGLGLSIVKNIVDLHKASITLSQSTKLGGLAIEVIFS